MSGVYIPNFEMPKAGYRQLFLTAEGEIIWYPTSPQNGEIRIRAIPVPDHGRLIDADEMAESIWKLLIFPSNLANAQWFVNTLREQPTIIPASKGEEL